MSNKSLTIKVNICQEQKPVESKEKIQILLSNTIYQNTSNEFKRKTTYL